jgi:cyclohexanecarboxylate-CoA ligase
VGASQFVGYFKRPQFYTVDAEGWLDTGDLARMDGEGYIRITGRAKDIIIRGGENIRVVEIEALLHGHPAVQMAAIVAMPDPRLGERACAFVLPRPDMTITFGEMCQFLKVQRVAPAYLPERLLLLDAMPMTPAGEVQKFVLRERARQLAGRGG